MPDISCDPNDLLLASKCLKCIPAGSQQEVITYLLAMLAGIDPDPNNLLALARCMKCIPAGSHPEVQTYLLCQISEQSMISNLLAAGVAQLVNGSVVVNTRFASMSNSILVSGFSPTITVPPLNYTNVVEGVSFQINSSVSSDQNLVSWAILRPFNP